MKTKNPIRIKKGLKIGELDAEADRDLMLACFVDKGELDSLQRICLGGPVGIFPVPHYQKRGWS